MIDSVSPHWLLSNFVLALFSWYLACRYSKYPLTRGLVWSNSPFISICLSLFLSLPPPLPFFLTFHSPTSNTLPSHPSLLSHHQSSWQHTAIIIHPLFTFIDFTLYRKMKSSSTAVLYAYRAEYQTSFLYLRISLHRFCFFVGFVQVDLLPLHFLWFRWTFSTPELDK